jgi:REP element-mobilizing transposase RayT
MIPAILGFPTFRRLETLSVFNNFAKNIMPTAKIKTPLEKDRYFHIYNKGNNHGLLFFKEPNYDYFLKRYSDYLHDHVSTYAYCLLPNHFHLLIRTKTQDASKYFRMMFQSYALSINKQENRSGSLFTKYFRRILIEDDEYLKFLVFYIHFNPEKHQIYSNYKEYRHSSYQSFFSKSISKFNRDEVYDWFGGIEGFKDFHYYYHEEKQIQKYILDEFDKGFQPFEGWKPFSSNPDLFQTKNYMQIESLSFNLLILPFDVSI